MSSRPPKRKCCRTSENIEPAAALPRRGRVFYVELRCSPETIIRRLGNASRVRFGKLTDAALYKTIEERGGFVFPPFPAPLVGVDTDDTGPEQAAELIAHALSKEDRTDFADSLAKREAARR